MKQLRMWWQNGGATFQAAKVQKKAKEALYFPPPQIIQQKSGKLSMIRKYLKKKIEMVFFEFSCYLLPTKMTS